jgi:2,3-bisphosphoglycerate-dependent phosphoglycerate mutase
MSTLIIIRHGQSTWNLENRFTGEVDVDLTPQGEQEAKRAGEALKGYHIEEAHTSVLKRAIRTLEIVLTEIGKPNLAVFKTAALNERNYGDLQGLNKAETEAKFGKQLVELWRRSYDVVPPGGESLKDTRNRVIPYFQAAIEPKLKIGTNILVVAHGNSLRALMMYLENISAEAIASVNIATGIPRLYEFDSSLRIINAQYLNQTS